MYKNPHTDDPISDEELDLPYTCEPQHDYFADVDKLYPRWVVPTAVYLESFPMSAALSEPSLREVRTKESEPVVGADGKPALDNRGRPKRRTKIVTRGMPFKRYFRAIDPAGNLCPLIVSSTRADRDKPSGDDGIGTAHNMVNKKNGEGWLVVEPLEGAWNPYSGKTGQDYCAWALAVAAFRRKRHADYESEQQGAWLEEKKRQALAIAREQAQITGQIQGEAMAAAVKEATTQMLGKGRREQKDV